jgi:hypothetical protein
MQLNTFFTCLLENNVVSGDVIGAYNLRSGDSNLIYNQLYSPSSHYISGTINGLNIPLVSVGNSIVNSGSFSGVNCYRIGYSNIGDFSFIADIQYSGCYKINLKDYVILSSNQISGISNNFILGINDSNRLFLQTPNYSSCLSKELSTHDFIYFSLLQNQYLEFGIFNFSDNKYYSNQIDFGVSGLNSDIIYLGSEFNALDSTTGFFGNINNLILFQSAVSNSIQNYCSCWYATGINNVTGTYILSVQKITGSYLSGFSQTINITNQLSGNISKENGSNIPIIYGHTTSSTISGGLQTLALYGQTGINLPSGYMNFSYDENAIRNFSNFNIEFTSSLQSGDTLEIYTNPRPIYGVGIQPINLNWPDISNGYVALVGNGLEETSGIDYNIVRTQIAGFDANDTLSYDIVNNQSVTIFICGSGIGTMSTINITGLGAICTGNLNYPNFGYDIYMNGQKLLSGYQYNISLTGTSGFSISITGDEIIDNIGGNFSIETSEIKFIQQYNGFSGLFSGVNYTTDFINGLAGFSEQIWVNGIRQTKNVDYLKLLPCSTISGEGNIDNLNFNFYNNDSNNTFNLIYPPSGNINYMSTTGISGSYLNLNYNWTIMNLNGYPSGTYLQFFGSSGSGNYNLISTLDVASTGYIWQISPIIHQNYSIKTRYRNGNVLGYYSSGYSINY